MSDAGRKCATCEHADLHAIERDLAEGKAISKIMKAYGLSRNSINHHRKTCIPALLNAARRASEETHGQRLVRLMNELLQDVSMMREQVLAGGDMIDEWMLIRPSEFEDEDGLPEMAETVKKTAKWRALLQVVREYRSTIMDLSRITGDVQDAITINVHQAPDFLEVRDVILSSIEPFPEAKEAMCLALDEFVRSKGQDAPTKH